MGFRSNDQKLGCRIKEKDAAYPSKSAYHPEIVSILSFLSLDFYLKRKTARFEIPEFLQFKHLEFAYTVVVLFIVLFIVFNSLIPYHFHKQPSAIKGN